MTSEELNYWFTTLAVGAVCLWLWWKAGGVHGFIMALVVFMIGQPNPPR